MGTEDNEKITITSLQPTGTSLFGVTPIEALAYVLSETGFINNDTRINDIQAYELAKNFYAKRNKFRQTTRLGHFNGRRSYYQKSAGGSTCPACRYRNAIRRSFN